MCSRGTVGRRDVGGRAWGPEGVKAKKQRKRKEEPSVKRMGKKSSGDVRQPMAGHAFAWLPLPLPLADCLHIGHTGRGCGGKGQVVPEERPLHIMCVWKDRNLSLTSHRQLSTYSFEVYLVVLLLPLLLLLLDCVSGGGGGGVSGASVFGHSFQPTERLNEAYAAEFVSLSTLLHFACFLVLVLVLVLGWCCWHCRTI